MDDPLVLLAAIAAVKLDIWHREPGGHGHGEVCGYPPHGVRRALWTGRHITHLHLRWKPYLNVRRWIVDRCEGCGQRFRWRETRSSYQSSERAVWHDPCMSLRQVKGQLNDITEYFQATADPNMRWRVENRIKHLDAVATAKQTTSTGA